MNIEPQIVFEDAALVAIDKPSGWLTVPSRLGKEDPRPCAGIWLKERLAQEVFPLHRLDVEVSGLVLFALNSSAHRLLSQGFENRQVKKTYHALTAQRPHPVDQTTEWIEWRSKLVRGKKRAFEALHGKVAITRARFVGPGPFVGTDSWEVEPVTGRGHQIRFHFSKNKTPILGDELYGGNKLPSALVEKLGPEAIALRAVSLEILLAGWSGPRRLLTSTFPSERREIP